MKSMGIDIGKRGCDVCIVDEGGRVLERRHCMNTSRGAGETARDMARKYP